MGNGGQKTIGGRFVDFIIGRAPIAFALGLIAVLALAYGGQKLKTNFTHTAFFTDADPMLREFNRFERQFGNDDALILVVHSPSGIFDKDSTELLRVLTDKMKLIPYVMRVDSLSNYSWVHSVDDDLFIEPLLPEDLAIETCLQAEDENGGISHDSAAFQACVKKARDTQSVEPSEGSLSSCLGQDNSQETPEQILERCVLEHSDRTGNYYGGEAKNCFRKKRAAGEVADLDALLASCLIKERGQIALSHEVMPDYLVSRDGKTAMLYARMQPGFETPPNASEIIASAHKLIAETKAGDHSFHVNGGPAVTFAFQDSSQGDLQRLVPLVLSMAVIFLALMLRSLGGVLLPFVVIIASVAAAMGIGGWLGIELSSVTLVLPNVLIAVAIADAVHILSGFYRARRRGTEKIEAVRYALEKNFVPTILTSLSTAAGFFAFSTAYLKPVLGLGVLAGCGAIVAWFASYLLMGPLLVWFPSWVKSKGEPEQLKQASAFAIRYTKVLERFRWPIAIVFLLFCAGAIALAASNTVNSDPYKYFAKDYPIRKSHDFILENLNGLASFEMSVETGKEDGAFDPEFLSRVEDFNEKLLELEGISKSISLVDVFKQTNRSLNEDRPEAYVLPETREALAQEFLLYTNGLPAGADVNDRITIKYDALRLTLITLITDSTTWTDTAEKIEMIGTELGLNVQVTGKTRLYQSMNGYVTRSFIQSLLIAVVLICVILVVAFRSLRVGLFAMLPNMIPLIIGGAALKLLGHTLDIGTVLVCSVCLGIAVDDTIHMLASFRRYESMGHNREQAVAMALTHTGPALVVTTLVLVAAFGTLGLGTFIPNVYFGIMSAIILVAALITDLTFLPAMLVGGSKKKNDR